MDPANLGVVLDSSIVIEAERQQLDAARFLKHMLVNSVNEKRFMRDQRGRTGARYPSS